MYRGFDDGSKWPFKFGGRKALNQFMCVWVAFFLIHLILWIFFFDPDGTDFGECSNFSILKVLNRSAHILPCHSCNRLACFVQPAEPWPNFWQLGVRDESISRNTQVAPWILSGDGIGWKFGCSCRFELFRHLFWVLFFSLLSHLPCHGTLWYGLLLCSCSG